MADCYGSSPSSSGRLRVLVGERGLTGERDRSCRSEIQQRPPRCLSSDISSFATADCYGSSPSSSGFLRVLVGEREPHLAFIGERDRSSPMPSALV